MEEAQFENRIHSRLRVKFDVFINNAVKADTLDISEGGMFIHTSIPFPQGTVVELTFTPFPGAKEIKVSGKVQYVHVGLAIGVEFIDLAESDRLILAKYIEGSMDTTGAGEAIAADTRQKVLVADDSAAARTMAKNKLMLMGLAVREVSNGADAIKAVEACKPDVIIFDYMMKGMDGEKFLHMLRSKDEWKGIKVVLLSGNMNPEQISRLSMFGITEILPKMTTTPKKLAEKIKEILDLDVK